MTMGAGPNLSGGLWMGALSAVPANNANGNANTGSILDCAGGPGGGVGGGGSPSPPGSCPFSTSAQPASVTSRAILYQ